MELYFLGTGAGMPSKQRNVTSVALWLAEERGTFWLFDCGEGTQHQVLESPLKPGKLEMIWITHLHGDHIYGLPGMLTSRSYQGGETPLTLYGPPGVRAFVETALQLSSAHLSYPLHIVEIANEGIVFEDKQFTVKAAVLDHRVTCLGYRIEEKAAPGPLLEAKLKSDGIAPGPVYAQLKRGETVTLQDGRTLAGSDYIGPSLPGRIVTILGDTKPCPGSKALAKDSDMLVHEATFAEAEKDLAERFDHSTSVQAAATALEAGARALVLTHLSSRYQGDSVEELRQEAAAVFSNVQVAEDHARFPIVRAGGEQ